jgi:hypothetical protein
MSTHVFLCCGLQSCRRWVAPAMTDESHPVGLGLNSAHAIADTKRMRSSANDDLCRFTASNHCLLRNDSSASVVLGRSADRLEKIPTRPASFPQEAH